MTKDEIIEGLVICVDKPLHWTSFQVVNKIRYELKNTFGIKKLKVGHAGTLDPLASGLLILCTGKKTKSISDIQGQVKTYTGTIRLGATTPSYDLETEINEVFDTSLISDEEIYAATSQFVGDIQQRPPIFSAIKKEGKRLYEHARAGEQVEINNRSVSIEKFEITEIAMPHVEFEVICSKGTYIRSLAYDFGRALNNGAHLSALRRTKIGDFDIEEAWQLDTLISELHALNTQPQ
jgi:tRNA pseudouridine55 synthase